MGSTSSVVYLMCREHQTELVESMSDNRTEGHPVQHSTTNPSPAVYHELSLFDTFPSPWTDPNEWTRLNVQHISNVAGKYLGLHAPLFGGIMIYQV